MKLRRVLILFVTLLLLIGFGLTYAMTKFPDLAGNETVNRACGLCFILAIWMIAVNLFLRFVYLPIIRGANPVYKFFVVASVVCAAPLAIFVSVPNIKASIVMIVGLFFNLIEVSSE